MCMGPSAPSTPAPLPVQAPPPPPAVLDTTASSTSSALKANRGRSGLRIDRTETLAGSAGSGLNIPS